MSTNKYRAIILPWFICGIGALFYSYEYFLRIAPSVMTAAIMHSYDMTATTFGVFASLYYMAYTPMQLPVGVLMDRFGPRKLLTLACFVCAVASFVFAHSQSISLAMISRFWIGFGSAFAFVGVLKLASIWLPANRFAFVAGLATTLGMVGGMVGDNLVAAVFEQVGWQNTIHATAIIGLVLTVVIFVFVRGNKTGQGEKKPIQWGDLFREFIKVLVNPRIIIVGIVGSLLYLSLSVFAELWGVVYLEATRGFSAIQAARAMSAVFLGWAVGGPTAGILSDKMQRRISPLTFSSLIAAVFITAVLYIPNLSPELIYVLLFFYGCFCSAQVIVFAVGKESAPANLAGTAVAVVNMFVMLGGVIFQPLVGILLDYFWHGELLHAERVYTASQYQMTLWVLPAGLVLASLLTWFLREPRSLD